MAVPAQLPKNAFRAQQERKEAQRLGKFLPGLAGPQDSLVRAAVHRDWQTVAVALHDLFAALGVTVANSEGVELGAAVLGLFAPPAALHGPPAPPAEPTKV